MATGVAGTIITEEKCARCQHRPALLTVIGEGTIDNSSDGKSVVALLKHRFTRSGHTAELID